MTTSQLHVFGIRHHGPGSARSLRQALTALAPDIVLIEGPAEAAEVLPLVAHPEMQPPVALLLYRPDQPHHAVYYPFAQFSPEWQAMQYGFAHGLPVRLIDLPLAHRQWDVVVPTEDTPTDPPDPVILDPLSSLAHAAGYSDGERWWEHLVEQRRDGADLFAAIAEAMGALRASITTPLAHEELQREAWMRRCIRQAQTEGFQRIAVVCGAWHAPALTALANPQADQHLLANLPTYHLQATWIPWSYGRLTYQSGYGAGVEAPGWYDHLWQMSADQRSSTEVVVRWMTSIAQLLRTEGLDASSAHVIEAVRLAEALAGLRRHPLPGLPELNEAAQAIFCFSDDLPLQLIRERLLVQDRLGRVPTNTPLAPLQHDLAHHQKRLRLPAEVHWRDYDFDLRKPTDLERSQLLHRLNCLNIPWGTIQRSGGGKGTFHELWRLEWKPELAINLIEAGVWGNTIEEAASQALLAQAQQSHDLTDLTRLIQQALLADVPRAIEQLLGLLEEHAALTNDIHHLAEALPPLAHVLRYGNVRHTDAGAVAHVITSMVTRIAIGLPGACLQLDDQAAESLFAKVVATEQALGLLQDPALLDRWHQALRRVAELPQCHGLVAGRAVRILLDAGLWSAETTATHLSLALSTASEPAAAAAWIDGLIRESGALLIHDSTLWSIIDQWLAGLNEASFTPILPLLRRSFASFTAAERRALGERARQPRSEQPTLHHTPIEAQLDRQRAFAALHTIHTLLGFAPVASQGEQP